MTVATNASPGKAGGFECVSRSKRLERWAAPERPVSHLKVALLDQVQLVDAFVLHFLLADVPPDRLLVSTDG